MFVSDSMVMLPGKTTASLHSSVTVGSDAVASRDLDLEVNPLPRDVTGIVLASRSAGLVSLFSGGEGDPCLGSRVSRFVRPGEIRNTGFLNEVRSQSTEPKYGAKSTEPGSTFRFRPG